MIEWNGPEGAADLLSGLSLLYMGPELVGDEYTERAEASVRWRDEEEAEHISAVLIVMLLGKGVKVEQWMTERWSKLFGAAKARS